MIDLTPVIAGEDFIREEYCHVSPSGMTIGQYGLVPRNYAACPVGYLPQAKPWPSDIKLIDESEWTDRLEILKKQKAQLTDIRMHGMYGRMIPSRDQDGYGYCWAHSSVSCCLLARAAMGEPYADLSAFAVACIIKGYRNRGGNGSESVEWIADNGCPSSEYWPQQGVDRRLDTPAMRANAKTHAITGWIDLEPGNIKQFVTCLLLNWPVISDFNWWFHSVATARLVSIDPRNPIRTIETDIWNSWGDSWANNGIGRLQGRKAIPDGAIALCNVMASAA